jgi:hypothetical protein
MSSRKGTLANTMNSLEKNYTAESIGQQLTTVFSCPHAIERQQACLLFFSAVQNIRENPDHLNQARIGELSLMDFPH